MWKKTKNRPIDELASKSYSFIKRKIVYMQTKEIALWKGLVIIFFAVGVMIASVAMVYFNIQGKTKAATGSAHLIWKANSESDLAGYKIYYSTRVRNNNCPPGGYDNVVDAKNVTSYDIVGLNEGVTYYFSITSYDKLGNESCFSNEVSKLIPVTPVNCTSFTYSSWSACVNNTQTRTVLSSSPSGCTGGSPVLTQSCTTPVTCTSFTYSSWSACVNNTQTRTVLSSSPSGCTGGSPVLTQSCTTNDATLCTSFKYSKWSACIDNIRTRTVLSSSPSGCTGGSPVLTQSCKKK